MRTENFVYCALFLILLVISCSNEDDLANSARLAYKYGSYIDADSLYRKLLKEYPDTEHRAVAERKLLKILTGDVFLLLKSGETRALGGIEVLMLGKRINDGMETSKHEAATRMSLVLNDWSGTLDSARAELKAMNEALGALSDFLVASGDRLWVFETGLVSAKVGTDLALLKLEALEKAGIGRDARLKSFEENLVEVYDTWYTMLMSVYDTHGSALRTISSKIESKPFSLDALNEQCKRLPQIAERLGITSDKISAEASVVKAEHNRRVRALMERHLELSTRSDINGHYVFERVIQDTHYVFAEFELAFERGAWFIEAVVQGDSKEDLANHNLNDPFLR